jgi:hypothetical protein
MARNHRIRQLQKTFFFGGQSATQPPQAQCLRIAALVYFCLQKVNFPHNQLIGKKLLVRAHKPRQISRSPARLLA